MRAVIEFAGQAIEALAVAEQQRPAELDLIYRISVGDFLIEMKEVAHRPMHDCDHDDRHSNFWWPPTLFGPSLWKPQCRTS